MHAFLHTSYSTYVRIRYEKIKKWKVKKKKKKTWKINWRMDCDYNFVVISIEILFLQFYFENKSTEQKILLKISFCFFFFLNSFKFSIGILKKYYSDKISYWRK